MRLTPEKIAEWKALVPELNNDSDDHMDVAHAADMAPQHTVNFRHAKNAHEAAWAITNLIADLEEAQRRISISEAFAKELSSELITTRKQLAEAQALIHAGQPTLDSSSIESVVAFWSTQCWRRAALDAAIAEAIADEKRNPWKQAIINELAVSYVLHTDHETDPVRALAALVDYECKVALDPAVSKEAQALIEPYRKNAERFQELLSRLGDDSGLTIVNIEGWSDEYPSYAWFAALPQEQVIAELDTAIAAKGDSNEQP